MRRSRRLSWVGCCVLASACGGQEAPAPLPGRDLIAFSPMYSAFGGDQTYSITPYVSAGVGTEAGEPVILRTVQWHVDDAFVEQTSFDEIDGAIQLTTKRAGDTRISLTAQLMSGERVRAESTLHISEADEADWQRGEARYSTDERIKLLQDVHWDEPGDCGVVTPLHTLVPEGTRCAFCHNDSASAPSPDYTPTQTAGYSDEQLIGIFAHAEKPAGYAYDSLLLKMSPQPDCIYAIFHGVTIPEEDQRGLVLKLRSLAPHKLKRVKPQSQ